MQKNQKLLEDSDLPYKYTWLNQSHFDRFFNNVMADMVDLDKIDYNKIEDEIKPEILLTFDLLIKIG